MDDMGVGYADVILTVLIVKEAFALVKSVIDKRKNGNDGNPQPSIMGVECRERFDRMERVLEKIRTSVVAPDGQPLHVTVRSMLGMLSKE